jgi:thiamine pyrophosphokinase
LPSTHTPDPDNAGGGKAEIPKMPPSPAPGEGFHLRAVIMANGELKEELEISTYLRTDDLLIAADGGASNLLMAGIQPHVVIGDLDSLTTSQIEELSTIGVTLIEHPQDKDQTDLELALRYATAHNAKEILLLGLLGGRLDQTLANLLLLTRREWESVRLIVKAGYDTAYLLRNQDEMELSGQPGDTLSLIPVTGGVSGVTTHGLRWPLINADLDLGTTLGISNEMVGSQCRITISSGNILLVHRTKLG